MIQFRSSQPGDVSRLRELWGQVFGDGDDFLNLFFSTLYVSGDALVGEVDARVITMLFLLPMTFVDGTGARWEMPYVYALATDPACRGKGHARALLAYADTQAKARGAAGICTVPAQASLHAFFASAGYREGLFTRRSILPTEALTDALPMEPETYNAARRTALAGTAYLDLPDALIAFQREIGRLSGAGLCRLDGSPAALERVEDELLWKDCLSPIGRRVENFGMLKWFDGRSITSAYLGLAFD